MYKKLLGVLVCASCTGLTLGENSPGNDTYLEDFNQPVCVDSHCYATGSIAVDARTDDSFVVQGSWRQQEDGRLTHEKRELVVIKPPVDGQRPEASQILDLSGQNDLRILFPAGGVLLMSEQAGKDQLTLLDRENYQTMATYDAGVRYHGTRMSPSRRYVAVADNTSAQFPIHIIDTANFQVEEIPHNGDWLEAMWSNQRDRLFAIVFYGLNAETGAPISARLLSWSVEEDFLEKAALAPTSRGTWSGADIDVNLPGFTADFFFSFTWVGISPDDRYAVFPVRYNVFNEYPKTTPSFENQLIVMDTRTGSTRIVRDAYGPVGFTPDGTTIVSYHYPEGGSALKLIDVETLEETSLDLPWPDAPSFFVTRTGNFVVVSSADSISSVLAPDAEQPPLVLYDLDQGVATTLGDVSIDLQEFVSRPEQGELWLVDDGLFRLDILSATLEEVPLEFTPGHINRLPSRDLLVLDDLNEHRLLFVSPTDFSTTRVALPTR